MISKLKCPLNQSKRLRFWFLSLHFYSYLSNTNSTYLTSCHISGGKTARSGRPRKGARNQEKEDTFSLVLPCQFSTRKPPGVLWIKISGLTRHAQLEIPGFHKLPRERQKQHATNSQNSHILASLYIFMCMSWLLIYPEAPQKQQLCPDNSSTLLSCPLHSESRKFNER